MAEHFNNYFVNVASNLKEPIVNSEFERLHTFVQSKVQNDVEFKVPLINVGFAPVPVHCFSITFFFGKNFFIKLECKQVNWFR